MGIANPNGDDNPEDIIKSISDGLYAKKMGGGSVKIKNNGQLAIDKVKVDFIEGNLSSGLTINNTEEITVNLKPGESKEISTKFIPKEAKNYNVQMKVTTLSLMYTSSPDTGVTFI